MNYLAGCAMDARDEFGAMADACIANHEEIMRSGSPEMQAASRLLLYALAKEILRRTRNGTKSPEDAQ